MRTVCSSSRLSGRGVCSGGCLLWGLSASGGCLLLGGVCSWGVSAPGGHQLRGGGICSISQHTLRQTSLPGVNITFATSLQTVVKTSFLPTGSYPCLEIKFRFDPLSSGSTTIRGPSVFLALIVYFTLQMYVV